MSELDAAEWHAEGGAAGRTSGSGLLGSQRALGLLFTITRLVVEARVEHDVPVALVARRAQRTAQKLLAIHGVELRCMGPRPTAPAILVSNHVSYLDPLVVSATTPCIAIAK